MGEQHDPRPGRPRHVGDQRMARRPGRRRQAGRRPGAVPANAAPFGPDRGCRLRGDGIPASACGAQSVVDGNGQQPTSAPRGPQCRQIQEGHGVAAAGQGQDDGTLNMKFKTRIQPLEDPRRQTGDRSRRVGPDRRQLHPARVFTCVARVRRAAVAPSA